jgi:integrase
VTTTIKRRTKTKAPGVYKSSSGKFEIQFYDSDGRSRFQTVDGSYEEAKQVRADLVSRMSKGERVSRTKTTFRDYAKVWLQQQKTEIRPRTYEVYEIAVRLHINPVIGDMKMSDVDEDDVLRVIARMKKNGKKAWTIRSVLTPLGRILGHAARKGKIASNPMARLERGERPKVERHEMRILTRTEIGKLLAGSPDRYRTALAAAVLSGMRLSEILGLSWRDVDFDAGVIHVRQQADRKGQLVEPKTPQAKRDIVLPPNLAKMLREHKMASRFKAATDLVFPTGTGRAQNGRNVSRRGLDKALENAKLEKLRFHDLRHTHCSLLISEGLNVVFVSRQMGHASPDITLKIYSHMWDAAEHSSKASAALDAVYTASS